MFPDLELDYPYDYPNHNVGVYDPARLRVELSFRDASDIKWQRSWTGKLAELNT